MTDIFLADVLRVPDVLSVVLGREEPGLDAVAADVSGYRLVLCDPAAQLSLVSAPDAKADGVMLCGVSEADFRAIDHYQRSFGRQIVDITCQRKDGGSSHAVTYVCPDETGEDVDSSAWCATWAEHARCMADIIMAFHGARAPEEIRKSLYSMRIRVDSWLRLQRQAPQEEFDLARDVVVHAHKRPYMNFFAAEEMDLQYRRFDGTMSPVINRGCLVVGQASVVLPYDPVQDSVLLVQQFRAPPYIMGDKTPWMWEPPAGLIDPGETPEEAARREAQEEAGLDVYYLDPVGAHYSSSGALAEIVHSFVGLADVSWIEGGGGVPGEGEDIRSKVISFQELMQGVDDHTYKDMPLVITALWLARHRDRLRAQAR